MAREDKQRGREGGEDRGGDKQTYAFHSVLPTSAVLVENRYLSLRRRRERGEVGGAPIPGWCSPVVTATGIQGQLGGGRTIPIRALNRSEPADPYGG